MKETPKPHESVTSHPVPPPPPPDGGYGWLVAFLSWLCHCIFYVNVFAFSVFYIEFANVFGKSKGEIGIVLSTHYFFLFATGIVTSPFVELYGPRAVGILGVLVTVTGLVASAFTNSLFQLVITYGLIAGIGSGIQFLPYISVVKDWFDKKRPLALAITSAGYSSSNFIGPPLTQYLISVFGWRGSFLVLAGISLQSVVLCALCRPPDSLVLHQRKHPATSNSCSTITRGLMDFSLLRNPVFLLVLVGLTMLSLGVNMAYQHIPSRAYSLGLSIGLSASIPTSMATGGLASRLPTGLLALNKSVNRTLLLGVTMIASGIIISLSLFVNTWIDYMVFGGIYAFVNGMPSSLRQAVLVDLFTPQGFLRAQGIVFASFALLGLGFIPISGWIYDVTDNYDIPFVVFGTIKILGGLLIIYAYFLHRRTAKISQKERELEYTI